MRANIKNDMRIIIKQHSHCTLVRRKKKKIWRMEPCTTDIKKQIKFNSNVVDSLRAYQFNHAGMGARTPEPPHLPPPLLNRTQSATNHKASTFCFQNSASPYLHPCVSLQPSHDFTSVHKKQKKSTGSHCTIKSIILYAPIFTTSENKKVLHILHVQCS